MTHNSNMQRNCQHKKEWQAPTFLPNRQLAKQNWLQRIKEKRQRVSQNVKFILYKLIVQCLHGNYKFNKCIFYAKRFETRNSHDAASQIKQRKGRRKMVTNKTKMVPLLMSNCLLSRSRISSNIKTRRK